MKNFLKAWLTASLMILMVPFSITIFALIYNFSQFAFIGLLLLILSIVVALSIVELNK